MLLDKTDRNEKVMSEVPIIPMSAIYTILKEQCENGSFYIWLGPSWKQDIMVTRRS